MKNETRSELNEPTTPGSEAKKGRRLSALKLAILTLIAVLSAFAIVSFVPSSSAQKRPVKPTATPEKGVLDGQTKISESALKQIQALDAEKESRTPAQRKIDSQLLYAAKMYRGEAIAAGVEKLEVNVGADAKGIVTVDISADIDDDLLAALKRMKIKYSSVFPEYHSLRAVVNLNQLETIAAMQQVRFIAPKQEFTTNQAAPVRSDDPIPANPLVFPSRDQIAQKIQQNIAEHAMGGSQTNVIPNGYDGVGSVSAEAVISHGVYSARGTFNTDGTGIRIGVLSDSSEAATIALSQASGDLPPTCSALPAPSGEHCMNIVTGQNGTGNDEGTAMMEVIHDIAPGAQLYFATANPTITQFATNIRTLRNPPYNCDIIVDDIGYFAESVFQDGQGPSVVSPNNQGAVTQAVNDVVASGALYFSSAANSGNLTDATAGTWEGDFTDGGTIALVSGTNHVNDFDPTAGVATSDLLTTGTGTAPLTLFWSDPLGGSSNDYDLYVLNSTLTTIITSSTNVQTGTQDPYEQTTVTVAANRRAVILQKAGAANRYLHLDTNRGVLSIATAGNTHGHNAASGAYGVAATPVFLPFAFPVGATFFNGPFPNSYSGLDKTETFSSDGPRRVFFQGDSTPFTPGNFSSTGGLLLQQPLIAASDGNAVSGVGGFGSPFYGTSCAAPTAAAIAGLLKGASPSLTPAQIKTALTTTAIDIEGAGVDRDTGFGVVMPYPAMQSLALPGKAFAEFNGTTVTESCGNADGLIEPGESANLIVNLKNTGLANATGVTANLVSNTAGIAVLQGTSAYPNIAISGGTAGNSIAFKIGIGPAVPVDQVASFTLTLTYAGGWNASQVINFTLQTGRQPIATTLDAVAPPTSLSFPVTATGSQTGRLNLTGVTSSCGAAKANPGASAIGGRNFDSYTLTNPSASTVCVTATMTEDKRQNDFIFHVGYSPAFVPATPGTNYLSDWGTSNRTIPMPMSFSVGAGQTIVLAVPGNTVGLTGTPYTLQVSGLPLVATPVSGCLVTAAGVTVSGRVTTAAGTGVRGASVMLTGATGTPRVVLTNAFGYFSIWDVTAGQGYVVNVTSRQYQFTSRFITVDDNIAGLNFTADH